MIENSLWEFAETDQFFKYYEPCSYLVSKRKNSFVLHTDLAKLNSLYEDVEVSLDLLNLDSHKFANLVSYFKNLPYLSSSLFTGSQSLNTTEIQEIKKFLYYTEKIVQIMPELMSKYFGLSFYSDQLLDYLKISDIDESFYLSEKYSESLAEVRRLIRKTDENIYQSRLQIFRKIEIDSHVDFSLQEFAIVTADRLPLLDSKLLVIEPYDMDHFTIKPKFDKTLLQLLIQREKYIGIEKSEEAEILFDIGSKIIKEKENLLLYQQILSRIDMAFAKAKMAQLLELSKPVLVEKSLNNNTTVVKNGRFLALQNQCKEQSTQYWPLNIEIKCSANLVVGSNMGGKTVVLRTLAFLQLVAQAGFFVPADYFKTQVFSHLCYLGVNRESVGIDEGAGLSSFGFEIKDFVKAWQNRHQPMLMLVDEFARTTNSREAMALLSGIISQIASEKNIVGVISTHFVDLKLPANNAQLFCLKGLAREAYEKYCETRAQLGEVERIRWIQKFMQYEVCESGEAMSDAINIAEILGLPSSIVALARKYLESSPNLKS